MSISYVDAMHLMSCDEPWTQVLEMLQGSAFRLFKQSAAFQPLLDLKVRAIDKTAMAIA